MRNNIWNAIDDYFRHSYSTDVRDDISDTFVNRLANDSIESKRELRELFRQSNGWNLPAPNSRNSSRNLLTNL